MSKSDCTFTSAYVWKQKSLSKRMMRVTYNKNMMGIFKVVIGIWNTTQHAVQSSEKM